ncbi:hypothetical protein QJ48_13490 [Paenibacillus sp. A3]|uniref:class I SAM-dependent methyltransferase n=1 Tax=Paenibacillus sp. A3 TaxID=1337054 RepID=UPI0006D562F4|nr:class I SAM-dependent methyltransferase [Paenibacillus sp. A3]KPV58962.1 hypothetical protein QJ48_13490 [Paenibacillus sp. A3]
MDHIERMNPFLNQNDLMFPEHYGRYMFALQFCNDKKVVDCSCGNGYGSYYLALNGAGSVEGIDISKEAIDFCKTHYKANNLTYTLGNALDLQFIEDHSVDTYVCFETIEHIEGVDSLLSEIKRVLKKDGRLIISCPNDNIFNPDNPFHVDIYNKNKFISLVEKYFSTTSLWVQNNTTGTSIMRPEHVLDASVNQSAVLSNAHPITPKDDEQADTWILVCSDTDLEIPSVPVISFFTTYSQYVKEVQDTINSLYKENQKLSNAWNFQVELIKKLEDENSRLAIAWNEQVEFIKKMEAENSKLSKAWEEHTQTITEYSQTIKIHEEQLKDYKLENEKLAEAWNRHTEYIKNLEENNKKLSEAWEIHTSYIKKLEEKLSK